MPAISVTRSAFTLTTTSRTVSVDVVVGDRVIVKASGSGSNGAISVSDGQSLTWTPTAVTDSGYTPVRVFTSSPVTAAGSLTVTLTRASGSSYWGADVEVWRSVDTFGSPVTGKGSSGAPSLSVTTTAANSAITWISGDINSVSVSTRTWNTTAGSVTENYAATPGASIYTSWWADTGTAGSKTVGLTKPTGQKWSAIAVPITFLATVTATVDASWDVDAQITGTVSASWDIEMLQATGTVAASWDIDAAITATRGLSWDIDARGTWRDYIATPAWISAVTAQQRVLSARVEMIDASGAYVADLPVQSGTVDFRGEQPEQWACSLMLTDPRAVPRDYRDWLDPRSGLRARIWWRLLDDGAWVDVPCGTYTLENPTIDDSPSGVSVSVTGRDQMALARRGGYGSAVVAVGGLTVDAALRRVFGAVARGVPLRIGASTATLPAVYELADRDPAKDWTEIADLAGWVVRTDREGAIVAGPRVERAAIVADWTEGPTCAVSSVRRALAHDSMVNRVIVRSTNPDVTPAIEVVAEDTDEGSPTWIGRWGPYELNIDSDAVASVDAAMSLARMHLGRLRLPQETVSVQVPPRPDLAYLDAVSLARARAGVGGIHQVSSWKLPLAAPDGGPGLMNVGLMTRGVA